MNNNNQANRMIQKLGESLLILQVEMYFLLIIITKLHFMIEFYNSN